MKRCKHNVWQCYRWDGVGWEEQPYYSRRNADAVLCECGSWLSLGPSNDSPAEVQIEIRAAELAHDDYDVALFDDTEWAGWNGDETYSVGGGEPLRSFDLDDRRWVAGHLARCISNESETRAIHTSREERE